MVNSTDFLKIILFKEKLNNYNKKEDKTSYTCNIVKPLQFSLGEGHSRK